jgi:hypothetical protein
LAACGRQLSARDRWRLGLKSAQKAPFPAPYPDFSGLASLAFVGFVAKSLSLALICSASVSSRSFFVIDPARKGAKTNFPFGF